MSRSLPLALTFAALCSCGTSDPEQTVATGPELPFVAALEAGKLGRNSGDSTRDVRFVGEELITLSSCAQRWNPRTGEERREGDQELLHRRLDGSSTLQVSAEHGYLGYSQAGHLYGPDGKERFHAKGSGHKKIVFIDGMDMFASFNAEGLTFYDRASAKFLSEQPISAGVERVAGASASYATATLSHEIVVWPLAEARKGMVLGGHEAKVVEIIYSGDESKLASADADGVVIVWDLASGVELQRFELEVSRSVPAVTMAFFPGAARLAANGSGGTIVIWELATGAVAATLLLPSVLDIDVSSNGALMAVGTAFSGRFDQNAPPSSYRQYYDRNGLRPGMALVFDVSGLSWIR